MKPVIGIIPLYDEDKDSIWMVPEMCIRDRSGHDIMEAGVKPGREVGSTLSRFLDMVLEEPKRNTKEYLLSHLE